MIKNISIILIILIILCLYIPKRYYKLLPTIPLYPNNKKEAEVVLELSSKRTTSDVYFFKLTDPSVIYSFKPYVNESISDLSKIILSINHIIFFFKYLFNRARPKQINKNINVLISTTAHTPAFPAGHAMQGYYLAKILSKKYPEKKDIFSKLAERCDMVRVKAGIHYPSDGKFSKFIVKYFL